MKHEGYNARLHESLGERHRGRRKQSLRARSHESEAMEKKKHGQKYGAVGSMGCAKKARMHLADKGKKG